MKGRPDAGGDSTVQVQGRFEPTQWTLVLRAREAGTPGAQEAWERFARNYWPPIYWFIRREGHGQHDAQDLTQGFYQHLIGHQLLGQLTERRGKFRSFLLTCLKHYLSDQRDRAAAQKRGGSVTFVSLDECAREETTVFEPAGGLTPDQLYDQRWARVVMDEATRRLREEYVQRGRAHWYELLKGLQPAEHGAHSYADLAAQLGATEQAVKNAVHRFRRRYGELLRNEIAQTVADPAEVEAEIQYLLQVFAR